MPSEYRLHPISILFNLGAQAKELVIPGIIVLLGSRRSEMWQVWAMFLLIPYLFIVIGRYISFRYRYDEHELVIQSGVIFRNERHIPYARIQNLDAVQNPLHRAFGVVKVRLETGGGSEPEATMSVLPLDALDEMRQRVFEGRRGATATDAVAEPVQPSGTQLLSLSPRDLMVAGLIENRGLVLIAALFGIVWETGLLEGTMDRLFGEEEADRGAFRNLFGALFGAGAMPWRQIGMMAAAFLGFLIFVRLLSMVWGLIRLYGYTLTRVGEDLRSEFGLFTRVVATVPMRRIQTLTVFEGPWHRLFGWAAVRVSTAGGQGRQQETAQREWLAPIIRRDDVASFLKEVLPDVNLGDVAFEPVHPRAIARELRVSAAIASIVSALLSVALGWWALAVFAILFAWMAIAGRQYVRHLGWALIDRAVVFRTGWLWRRTSVARFTRIQAVSFLETPFDRRTGMARVRVDTAGADSSASTGIPYLGRDIARGLHTKLSSEAASTEFRW